MTYEIGQEVVSTEEVIGVKVGTIGVITDIMITQEIYVVIFSGGKLRYLYNSEFKLKEVIL